MSLTWDDVGAGAASWPDNTPDILAFGRSYLHCGQNRQPAGQAIKEAMPGTTGTGAPLMGPAGGLALQQMINNARAAGGSLVKTSEKLVTKVPPAEG